MKTLGKALGSGKPVLVVFTRVGGQNASIVKHQADELKKRYADKAEVVMVDATFDKAAVKTYNLKVYPTWILLNDKAEAARAEGEVPTEAIAGLLKNL